MSGGDPVPPKISYAQASGLATAGAPPPTLPTASAAATPASTPSSSTVKKNNTPDAGKIASSNELLRTPSSKENVNASSKNASASTNTQKRPSQTQPQQQQPPQPSTLRSTGSSWSSVAAAGSTNGSSTVTPPSSSGSKLVFGSTEDVKDASPIAAPVASPPSKFPPGTAAVNSRGPPRTFSAPLPGTMNVANGNSSTPATAATDASSSPDQQHTHVSTNGQRNSSSSRTSVGGVQQPGQQQQQQQFYSPYYPMQTNGAMGAGMPPQQQQGYIPQQAQQQRPPTHHQKPPRPSTSNNTATSDSTSSSGANTRRESQVAGASGGGNGRSSVVSTSTTSSNLPSTSAPVFTPAAHNQQQQLYQQHQTPSHPHHQPAHMMHPQFGYPTPPPHMLPQHFMQHHPQQYGGSGGVPPHYGGGDVYGGYYAGGQPYGYPTMGHPPPSTTAGGGGAPIRIGGGVSMPPPSSSSAASNTIVSSSASTASSVGPSPSSTPTSIHAPRLSTTLSNSSSSSISSSLVIPATPSKAIRIVNPLTNKEVKIDSPASIKKSSTNASVENLPSLVVGGGSSSSSASVTTSARASVVSVAELVPAAPSTATTAATSRTSIATTGVTVAAIAAAIPVSVSAQTPTTPSSTTISTASPANVVVPKKSTAIVFRDPVTGEVMNFSKSKVKIVDPKTLEEVVNKSTASTGAPVEVKPAVVVKPSVAPSPAAAAQVSVASAAAAVVPPASSPAVSSAVTSSAAPTTAVPAVSSKPVAAAIAPTTTATKSTTSTPAEKPLQVSTSSLQTSASNSSSSDINVVEPILKSSPRSVSPNKIGMKRSASPAKDLAIDTKPSSAGSPVSVEKPKTASLVSAAPSTAAAVALSAVPKDRAFTVISSNEGFKYPEGIPAPVINQGVQAPSYSKLFLMAMKDKVMVKPAGLVDVASLIEADAMSSPRTGGGPKSARGGSMSSGGSGRGHPFGGMGFGGNNNSGGNRGGPPMQHQGSGRGGVPLGSKSSRNSAPRRQPSRGDSRDFGSGRNESSRGGRYSTNQNQVVDNTPFEPIVVSENAWRPKVGSSNSKPVVDESSIEVAIGKECTAILNKLTPERFEPLSDQILNLPIENEELLRIIINKIFDKALFEAFYARQYALLCSKLSDKLPHLQKWISIDAKNNAFRRALLNKCQEEFESGTTWAAADLAAREQAKLVNEMTQEEKDTFLVEQESRNKAKIRTLGNMRFIGELFIAGLITEKIMHSCVVQLISNNVKDPEEEAIESLCKLLMTVGKKLDSAQAARHLDAYFNQISEFSTNLKLQSRIRFMLKDLIEMRANNWKARIQNAGPKTLAEIHKDIQKAAEQKEQGGGRGGRNSTSGRRDMPNLHDQFGGGRNGSSRGGRGSRDNRLPTSDGWTSVGGGGTSMKSSASQSSKPDMTEFGKIGSGGNSKVLGPNYGNGKGFSGGSKGWQQQQQGGSASNSFVAAKESVKSGEGSSNMFGLLMDQQAGDRRKSIDEGHHKQEAVEEPSQSGITREEAEKKIPGAIAEWFGLLDIEEMRLSTQEIGFEYQIDFIMKLLETTIEKKKDLVEKTARMLATLCSEEVISPSSIINGFEPLIENAEELSFDVPGIFKSFGILLGHLVASGVFTVLEILDLTSVLACGSNPSSCKVLGEVLKNFYIESGEEAVVSSTSFDELKRMWVDGQVDQETYAAWLDRYELEFLKFSDGATSGEGANDWISELKKSVGDIPVGDILKNLEAQLDDSERDSPEFIYSMSECLLEYMTSQTIFANGNTDKPSECTRDIFLKLEEIMKTIGQPLLTAFMPQTSDGQTTANEKSKQMSILKSCQSYCQSVKYPKSLLEHLFRLIYDAGLVEESLFIEWKAATSAQADKKEAVKQLEGWFKWLEGEK